MVRVDNREVRPTSRAPVPVVPGTDDQLRLMRNVAAGMCALGGATSAIGIGTAATPAVRSVQIAITGLAVLTGGALVALPPRKVLCQVSVALGIAMVGVLVGEAQSVGTAPMFYLWPVAFAAYFFTGRELAVVVGVAAASLAVALAVNDVEQERVATFVETASSIGVMAALLVHMNRRERRLRDELAHAASVDPLTGVLNRRAFDPALEELVEDAAASGSALSVVMFDLDGFKRFNDDHGHLLGDEALRVMARVLERQSRNGDLVARLGGEEFAVALVGADVRRARGYADRVGVALRRATIGSGHHIATSAGIAELAVDGPATVGALLAAADEALYEAKAGGRGRAAWREADGRIRVDEVSGPLPVDAATTDAPRRTTG